MPRKNLKDKDIQKIPTKAPSYLRTLFWDTDLNKLDPQKNWFYVVERLLERGSLKSTRWLIKHYPKSLVTEVLLKSRRLHPKTGNFWADYFSLSKSEVVCLQKSFRERRKMFWPY